MGWICICTKRQAEERSWGGKRGFALEARGYTREVRGTCAPASFLWIDGLLRSVKTASIGPIKLRMIDPPLNFKLSLFRFPVLTDKVAIKKVIFLLYESVETLVHLLRDKQEFVTLSLIRYRKTKSNFDDRLQKQTIFSCSGIFQR